MAFVAGGCSFGNQCLKFHPHPQEVARLRETYAKRACMYGAACRSDLCLFRHPGDEIGITMALLAMEGKADNLEDVGAPTPRHHEVSGPAGTTVPRSHGRVLQGAHAGDQGMAASPEAPPTTLSGAPAAQTVVAPAPRPLPLQVVQTRGSVPSRISAHAVVMPQRLWVDSSARDPSAFHIANPLARLAEVSKAHASDDVIDLHFQSRATVAGVIDAVLPECMRIHGHAWVLTGSGHHVPQGSHQSKGGVLYETVRDHLEAIVEASDWYLQPVKDVNGFPGGFHVKRLPG
mmetsp:Transcript_18945/g.46598  ORF Transcript_18945/g.46598 Transcript_18945/m.46598 type:complete len:289 (+) Transcript_18945:3-869(+)